MIAGEAIGDQDGLVKTRKVRGCLDSSGDDSRHCRIDCLSMAQNPGLGRCDQLGISQNSGRDNARFRQHRRRYGFFHRHGDPEE